MNRFSRSSLAIALIAMFAQRVDSYPSMRLPERKLRSSQESACRIAAAQAKRERRMARNRRLAGFV